MQKVYKKFTKSLQKVYKKFTKSLQLYQRFFIKKEAPDYKFYSENRQ
ncbi:hypothetical protein BPUTSESOX_1513 [uncultured Gammaproteobacteria bacterium]|nr:hypothetical protein BPUTSESOX_1513 [uncultured Gammaproteobacteria bacterium]